MDSLGLLGIAVHICFARYVVIAAAVFNTVGRILLSPRTQAVQKVCLEIIVLRT